LHADDIKVELADYEFFDDKELAFTGRTVNEEGGA
jgi:hypothetical protein